MTLEFKLTNPQNEDGFIKAIEFNHEELKAELTQRLEKYQNLTFTEETIKEAKETRAGLNKFKEAIDTRRKEIKSRYLQPYNEFEAKVKELTGLVDQPIKEIDTQLQTFEEKRIAAKRADITDFYNANIGDLSEILTLDKIFGLKWLNATYKMTTIQAEILETIAKVKGDLNVITDLKLDPDMELQVKDKYLQTLDFSLAMAEKNRLQSFKKAIKERETIQEEQQPAKNDEETTQQLENVTPFQAPKTYYKEFWVRGTELQLRALGKYLKDNNIEYGGIEKCQSQIA